jgi:tRNA(Ile)-lysidine synthase
MDVLETLDAFFRHEAPLDAGDGVVVGFSGGADSTALLWGMSKLSARRGLRLHAAHLDHAMDAGSAGRAAKAGNLAGRLGVPLTGERCDTLTARRRGESAEAAARRVRYEFLERTRQRLGARYIATAHHRDDQAETVLLRLLFGSGVEGLAGVRPVYGTVVRPLLALPRAVLAAAAAAAGLEPADDPTNRDLGAPRNRVRHFLLPALAADEPDLAGRLARLAGKARAAAQALDRRFAASLPLRLAGGGVAVERRALESLPAALQPFAFAWLHRQAGAPYPAGGAARAELCRQLAERPHAACDCGGGWRWEAMNGLLVLRHDGGAREKVPDFTYTLEIPGTLHIPEIAVSLRVYRRAVEPWMFQGSPYRAGLALPLHEGDRVTVRNRRPGDRIQPLGASGSRRLKEVLIDRGVPRQMRPRLPLLCVAERIAWVPGIAIDQSFRLHEQATAWVAEVATT